MNLKKIGSLAVFCSIALLAAGQIKAASRFVVSLDGTEVTDSLTGLIWLRCPLGGNYDGSTCVGTMYNYTWDQAIEQGQAYAATSGVPWRVPNVKELQSVTDVGAHVPALDVVAFPGEEGRNYWTSTPLLDWPRSVYIVSMNYGDVDTYSRDIPAFRLRLVRSP